MKLIDRIRQWAEIQKVRPVLEAPGVTGGREGELLLNQLVGSSFQFKEARLLSGRRIPAGRQGRRREIDLIVCTPRAIYLIEVKNWSGRLSVRHGAWIQERRSGDVVDHGDLLRENRLRRDAVVEYLGGCGIPLDDAFIRDHIVPQIVLTNPKLELDADLEARADVISRRELDGYLGRPGKPNLAERLFSSLAEFWLDREARPGATPGPGRIPPAVYEAIVMRLTVTDTWDRLQFFGGRVVTGDVVSMRIGAKTHRRPELLTLALGYPIRLRWTRGRLWGLFKAITGLGRLGRIDLGSTRFEGSTADTVLFHAVGEREASTTRLVELEQIALG